MEQGIIETQSTESAASAQLVVIAQLRRQLEDLMRVDAHEVLKSPDEAIAFRGQVYGDTEAAFEQMSQRFAEAGYTALLRDWREGHEAIAVKGKLERRPGRVWVNVALFLATLLSALFIGALQDLGFRNELVGLSDQEVTIMALTHLYRGIPSAATIMTILLAHELSHYFIGRRYGSPFSLPYFIPMPVGYIGTMGAVIVQRSPMRNRKVVFDAGIAGPLGGLIVAIPLLVLGLSLSSVGPLPLPVDGMTIIQEGNSLLYLALKYLVFAKILPSNGVDVWLHPVAFAAWAGLLVTMMNLIPVGQLDGGHISYALLGRWARWLGDLAVVAMLAWGGWLVMGGNGGGASWLLWGFLNMAVNRRHPPPVDDATKLGWPRILLGLLMLVIFILLFMPSPIREIVL